VGESARCDDSMWGCANQRGGRRLSRTGHWSFNGRGRDSVVRGPSELRADALASTGPAERGSSVAVVGGWGKDNERRNDSPGTRNCFSRIGENTARALVGALGMITGRSGRGEGRILGRKRSMRVWGGGGRRVGAREIWGARLAWRGRLWIVVGLCWCARRLEHERMLVGLEIEERYSPGA